MGVDYDPVGGVGYEVEHPEYDVGWSLEEYIGSEQAVEGDFDVSSEGSEMSGNYRATYLCLKDPFKWGLDLGYAKSLLDEEVKRLGLTVCSDFNIHLGICIS